MRNLIKDIIRRRKFGVQQSTARATLLKTQPPSMTQSYFWLTMKLKDTLTFYLANKVLQLKIPVVTVTRLHVKSNMNDVQPSTGVSTQDGADTLIMQHTAETCKAGKMYIS